MYMEVQKAPNSQNNPGKNEPNQETTPTKLDASHFLISNYTTQLQWSKEHGTGIEMDTQINVTQSRAQN